MSDKLCSSKWHRTEPVTMNDGSLTVSASEFQASLSISHHSAMRLVLHSVQCRDVHISVGKLALPDEDTCTSVHTACIQQPASAICPVNKL